MSSQTRGTGSVAFLSSKNGYMGVLNRTRMLIDIVNQTFVIKSEQIIKSIDRRLFNRQQIDSGLFGGVDATVFE
jgi:hypothetical protein